MKKPVALIDLDGTLADFHGAMTRDLQSMQAPEELFRFDPNNEDAHPHLKARFDIIKRQPDWWFRLPPIARGFRVVDMLRSLDYKIHICTRASPNIPSCWEQKVRWVNEHVKNPKKITITQDKSLVSGAVLMDDWPGYVEPWLKTQPQGLVILPDSPWNQGLKHPRIVRHTDNDDVVYEALEKRRKDFGE